MSRSFWRLAPAFVLLVAALPACADEPKPADKPKKASANKPAAAEEEDASGVTLKMGSPAPQIFASHWLNGDGVKKIEKGKVYVVEFWATWCGPCITAIPHLSELNNQYKDKGVVFVGMNLGEDLAKVEPFVKKMGEKMNYRVAVDATGAKKVGDESPRPPSGKTAAAWFEAAGQQGIPCTFVVNQDSVVAWIGHPMQVDKVLEQIVAGSYDLKQAAALAAKQAARQKRWLAAARSGDADKMLAAIDGLMADEPDDAAQYLMMKFNILMKVKKDYEAASDLAASAGEKEFKDNAQALNMLAWEMLDTVPKAQRDVDTALKLATRAADLTKRDDGAILDTLARAYFEKGDVAKAIDLQTQAIAKASADLKANLQETLDRYKKSVDK